jgi:hypothetical protein
MKTEHKLTKITFKYVRIDFWLVKWVLTLHVLRKTEYGTVHREEDVELTIVPLESG